MFFGIGIHTLIAIYFAVHAVRAHQSLYWVLILFSIPGLGSLVYFLAIYLPEMRYSRGGQAAKRMVRQVIDPGRALRDARHAFDLTPTVDRRLRLAAALLDAGECREALAHYREAAAGPFARDPAVLTGLARAQFETEDFAGCLATLNALYDAKPESKRLPEISLLQARAMAATGHLDTREAFQIALTVAGDPEAKCRYADWLLKQGEPGTARSFYQEIIADSRHWHSHAKSMNKEWLRRAQAALSELG
jgi:hypothetical protein